MAGRRTRLHPGGALQRPLLRHHRQFRSHRHTFQGFDGYLVVDARVHYQWDDNWSLAAGIDNLNNDKYFLFHPFPQRTFVMEIHYAQ